MSSPAVVIGERRSASLVSRVRGSLVGRNPALARMLLAGFVSTCGDRLHQVALAALILGMTNSMVSAGLVFVVSTIPYALFGLLVGALVDRWDRRVTMVVADLVRGVLVMLIPLAAALSLPLVYPLLFALTCATMVFNPARHSTVPDLVSADELSSANSLFQAVNYLVDLLAFPIAGVVVAALIERLGSFEGTQVAFAVDALSYVASALLLVRLPAVKHAAASAREPLSHVPHQIAEGLRFLRDNVAVRTNTILLTVGPLMLGSLHTLWIGFAWRVSNTGTFGYGVTETSNAIGTLVGLLVLRRVSRHVNAGRLILIGIAGMGTAIAAAGLTDSLAVVAVLAACAGVGNMVFLVPSITLVQRLTPSALRGRVFAVRLMLTFTAFSISNAVAGGLSDSVGVSPLLLILGSGMLLLAVCATFVRSAREVA
jgi:MFS family permease